MKFSAWDRIVDLCRDGHTIESQPNPKFLFMLQITTITTNTNTIIYHLPAVGTRAACDQPVGFLRLVTESFRLQK
jgi:hypothetical protein